MRPDPNASSVTSTIVDKSTIVDNPAAGLADTLRQERTGRGWSLSDLATRSGVSRAMIHKLETGQSSPTAALLGKLSGALGLTVSQMLQGPGAPGPSELTRAQARTVWQDPETGYLREQVAGGQRAGGHRPGGQEGGNGIDLVRVTLPAGQAVSYPAQSYRFIRQTLLVEAGTLTFHEGPLTHQLSAGDSLSLGAPADCRFANDGPEPCVYLVIVARM